MPSRSELAINVTIHISADVPRWQLPRTPQTVRENKLALPTILHRSAFCASAGGNAHKLGLGRLSIRRRLEYHRGGDLRLLTGAGDEPRNDKMLRFPGLIIDVSSIYISKNGYCLAHVRHVSAIKLSVTTTISTSTVCPLQSRTDMGIFTATLRSGRSDGALPVSQVAKLLSASTPRSFETSRAEIAAGKRCFRGRLAGTASVSQRERERRYYQVPGKSVDEAMQKPRSIQATGCFPVENHTRQYLVYM